MNEHMLAHALERLVSQSIAQGEMSVSEHGE